METIVLPDRTITRLSPLQTWVIRYVTAEPRMPRELPPQSNVREAARRLVIRGMIEIKGDLARYRPLASIPVTANTSARQRGDLRMDARYSGRTRHEVTPYE